MFVCVCMCVYVCVRACNECALMLALHTSFSESTIKKLSICSLDYAASCTGLDDLSVAPLLTALDTLALLEQSTAVLAASALEVYKLVKRSCSVLIHLLRVRS